MKKSMKKMRLTRMEGLLLISVVMLLATMIVGGLWLVNDSSFAASRSGEGEFTKIVNQMVANNTRNQNKDNYKADPPNFIEIDCYNPDAATTSSADGKLLVECVVRQSSNEPLVVTYDFTLDGKPMATTDLTNNVLMEMDTGFQVYSLRFKTNEMVAAGRHEAVVKVTNSTNAVSKILTFNYK